MTNSITAAFAGVRADMALTEQTATRLQALREARETRRPRALPTRMAALAAVAAVLAVCLSWPVWFTASAHVGIDLGPAVELTLNRFDRVLRAEAYDADGARVLASLNLGGKACAAATAELLSALAREGYLAGDVLVSVTVQSDSGAREQALCDTMLQAVASQVEQTAEVEVVPVTGAVWKDATGRNMSPARYLALCELMEADETAVWEEYADAPLSQIRQRTMERHGMGGAQGNGNGQGNGHGHENGQGQGNGYRGGR